MNVSNFQKLYLIVFFMFLIVTANSQQSLGYSYKPEGTFDGILGKISIDQRTIENIPIYQWYRGCGPTALGMVVGYYDSFGFSDLVIGEANTQTTEVDNMMASSEHYTDYSLPKDYYPTIVQDNSELGGAHVSNSIADYMYTSWSSRNNYWGWSWANDMRMAFSHYATQQNANYIVIARSIYYNSDSWNKLKNEIDNNRPVVLLVDTDGNGNTDHFVTGIGYNETTHQYACYNTWDNDMHWYEYRPLSSSYSWGVYNFSTYEIANTLSVNDKKNLQFSIFPNPSSGIFKIKINSFSSDFNIEVYDVTGKLLFDTNNTEINLMNCQSGVYGIKILNGNQVFYANIIKN